MASCNTFVIATARTTADDLEVR